MKIITIEQFRKDNGNSYSHTYDNTTRFKRDEAVKIFLENAHRIYKDKIALPIEELKNFQIKAVSQIVNKLVNQRVVMKRDNLLIHYDNQLYCNRCIDKLVYHYELKDHLKDYHNFTDLNFNRYIVELEFSAKPLECKEHKWKVLDIEMNQYINIICENCNYKSSARIEYSKDCKPLNTSIFIEERKDNMVKFRYRNMDMQLTEYNFKHFVAEIQGKSWGLFE